MYIVMVASLLFLAFAFFAVGQASATRNGAQGAADAAALAAAKDARGQLRSGFINAIGNPASWQGWLNGQGFLTASACSAADRLADANDADVLDCARQDWPDRGFTVEIETRYTVGRSVIPGTENKKATAEATAVIEPRCRFKEDEDADEDEENPRFEFRCDGGKRWIIDPGDEDFDPWKRGVLPSVADLFSVRLDD
ncbi:pilus assembly protein TadG-related protein [Streptomyces gobiensis]|nr:pilus assembly protein TadG-related protein [Streptomyces gobiensis]